MPAKIAPQFDPDIPRYFSGDVCRAAKIPLATLKNWISRDPPAILMGKTDRAGAGKGSAHLFTFRRTMQVAITARLVELGLPPREAGMIAAGFTDLDNGPDGSFLGDAPPVEAARIGGLLYAEGETLLIGRVGEQFGETLHLMPEASWSDLLGARTAVAVIVHINPIWHAVAAGLGAASEVSV